MVKNLWLISICIAIAISCRTRQEPEIKPVTDRRNDCSSIQATADSLKAAYDSLDKAHMSLKRTEQLEKAAMQLVENMYNELFVKRDLSAINKYIADGYIQHNPNLADGKDALMSALEYKFNNTPSEKVEIMRMAAEGDIVFVHVRLTSAGKSAAVTDIYRVKNNRITEHWDVIQDVPRRSVSRHPMF